MISFKAKFKQPGATATMMKKVAMEMVMWPPRVYSFTCRDIEGSVLQAAVLPSRSPCAIFPPLLSTHGAEFDATKRAWTESYRPQAGSWVILPTGRRRYVINLHGKQLLPAQAALSAFDRDMQGV